MILNWIKPSQITNIWLIPYILLKFTTHQSTQIEYFSNAIQEIVLNTDLLKPNQCYTNTFYLFQ